MVLVNLVNACTESLNVIFDVGSCPYLDISLISSAAFVFNFLSMFYSIILCYSEKNWGRNYYCFV